MKAGDAAFVEPTGEGRDDRPSPAIDHAFGPEFHAGLKAFDVRNITLLSVWAVLLYFTGLRGAEFFRHTEADRVLIAWEMLKRGDFVVPHILGSPILTKPPLFYWILAAAIKLFGGAAEWIVRIPSALTALMFLLLQYFVLRRVGAKASTAFLGAFLLSTGVLFTTLATVAEIDMFFGFLSAAALYTGYFSIISPAPWKTALCYFVLGLSFLAKGPPVVFFFVVAHVLFFLWHRRRAAARGIQPFPLLRFIGWNLLGGAIFFSVVMSWAYFLLERVAFAEVRYHFQTEVIERIFAPSTHVRGSFYYAGDLLANLLPWSLFLVLGILVMLVRKRRGGEETRVSALPSFDFLAFNVIVVVSGVLMLSIAEGKSTRYAFPLYAFAMNLCLFGLLEIRDTAVEGFLFRIGKWLSLVAACACFFGPWFVKLGRVPRANLIESGVCLGAAMLLFAVCCYKRSHRLALLAFAVIALSARLTEQQVFWPYRNATRSVKGIATSINALVPPGVPVYTVELFERWVIYYLERLGRECERLTPLTVKAPQAIVGRVYLLLSVDDELWRGEQLYYYDKSLKLLREYDSGKEQFLLLEAAADKVRFLAPHKRIPTIPSPAYYSDAADWNG